MRKNDYQPLGKYIEQVNVRNRDLTVTNLMGVSIEKRFIPSIANTIGTDLSPYKIVKPGQFAYGPVTSRNGDKITIALYNGNEDCIISQAYEAFRIKDTTQLLPEYLMMWAKRPEFDRYARYMSHGSVRELFSWEEMCNVMLPVPPIEEQRRIVSEYQTVEHRIANNEALIQKLEETAQAIYHHTFVEGIDEENLPEGWRKGCLEDIAIIIMGQSPNGNSLNEEGRGDIFYQGRTDFGFRYPNVRVFSEASTRYAEQKDILMSVRAPVGDLNIAPFKCAIGRGISAIREKRSRNSFIFYLLKEKKKELKISDDAGTVFGSINKEGLHSLPLIVPSDNDIERFHSQVSLIDKYIESLSFESFHLRTLLSLLTSKLS